MATPKKKAEATNKKTATKQKGPIANKRATRETPELVTKQAIHVGLGEKLTELRGDEQQERVAIADAIAEFMKLAIASGLPATTSAYDAHCPEFFWEGDSANPPVYARVPDATHDEIGRWFKLIVEGVRAYDARVSATARA